MDYDIDVLKSWKDSIECYCGLYIVAFMWIIKIQTKNVKPKTPELLKF